MYRYRQVGLYKRSKEVEAAEVGEDQVIRSLNVVGISADLVVIAAELIQSTRHCVLVALQSVRLARH
jgi:hypothetical protein